MKTFIELLKESNDRAGDLGKVAGMKTWHFANCSSIKQ